MVISRRCAEVAPFATSAFTERMRRSRKDAPHPTTDTIQAGPELSARDANKSPATKSTGLVPFITVHAFLLRLMATGEMLAPPGDKCYKHPRPRHTLSRGSRFPWRGEA